MAWSSKVVNSPYSARCVMRQSSYVRCVDTSVTRWEMWIWLAVINFHTSCIQESVCNHHLVSGQSLSNICHPLPASNWRLYRLVWRSGLDGVGFQKVLMRKAIRSDPWITIGLKITMPPREWEPYLTAVWILLLILVLVSPNFTIGRITCLHYFSFSFMAAS